MLAKHWEKQHPFGQWDTSVLLKAVFSWRMSPGGVCHLLEISRCHNIAPQLG